MNQSWRILVYPSLPDLRRLWEFRCWWPFFAPTIAVTEGEHIPAAVGVGDPVRLPSASANEALEMGIDARHDFADGGGEVCVVLEDKRGSDPAACDVSPELGMGAPAAELGRADGVFWGMTNVVGFGFVGNETTVDLRRKGD